MKFSISGGNKSAEYSIREYAEDGVVFAEVSFSMPQAEIPEQFSLNWVFSGVGCCCVWNPHARVHQLEPDWGVSWCKSRLASWMPVQQLVSFSGKNKLCVAVSDVDTPITVNMGYSEETADVVCSVDFFTVPTNRKDSYTAIVRLDTRDIPFYDSIYDVSSWWENECGYESAYVPKAAKQPMDSLWYSFHQELNHEEIVNQCKNSKALGMETVIIDDGWQTDDNNRGYAYCGDWQVSESKMGDMAELVERIHETGMKVMLWYSVPFVGLYSKKYNEFKDCFLDGCGNGETSFALDPRYKKVRDFLADIYENAVKDWKLDGLKLDFIDSFRLRGKSLEYDERRDYQSLEEAIHALLGEIKARLSAINPDILIEFRQSYVGPSIKKYGNMLRVGDCPGDIVTNRSQIINLRMTSGKTAVHSDMIMWNENDSVENAAMQFANVIFAVPQISMIVENLPEDHVKMLKYYIEFWKKYSKVLLDGKLTVSNVETDYSFACSALEDCEVAAVYTNPYFIISKKESVVVNAGALDEIVIKTSEKKQYEVVNCMGDVLLSGEIEAGLSCFNVPQAGMLFVKSI